MSNIHFLGEKPASLGTPNGSVVEMLENALSRARSGELQTILAVGHTSDGGVLTMHTAAAHNNYFLHLGALEALKAEFIDRQSTP